MGFKINTTATKTGSQMSDTVARRVSVANMNTMMNAMLKMSTIMSTMPPESTEETELT